MGRNSTTHLQTTAPPFSVTYKNGGIFMKKNQRFIEVDGQRVPVTEEVYLAYMRPIWVEKKRQERWSRCRTKNGNRCTADCSKCDRNREGIPLSLDLLSEEGQEFADSSSLEEIVAYKLLLEQLFAALEELSDQERDLIDQVFYEEKSERSISAGMGIAQQNVNKLKKKILKKLHNLLTK